VLERAANRGLLHLTSGLQTPFGLFGGPNRRKSPAVFENIPAFRRPRPKTWVDRDCEVRAAAMPEIHLSIFLDHLIGVK